MKKIKPEKGIESGKVGEEDCGEGELLNRMVPGGLSE